MVHVLCMMNAFCTEQSVQTACEYKTMQAYQQDHASVNDT